MSKSETEPELSPEPHTFEIWYRERGAPLSPAYVLTGQCPNELKARDNARHLALNGFWAQGKCEHDEELTQDVNTKTVGSVVFIKRELVDHVRVYPTPKKKGK